MASTRKATTIRRDYKRSEHARLRNKKVRRKLRKLAAKNPLKSLLPQKKATQKKAK